MKSKNKKLRIATRPLSSDVLPDLTLPNPEQEPLNAYLTSRICTILKKRGMTQTEAAKLLGIQQPRVSQLLSCQPGSFSAARLMELLTLLGQNVKIAIGPARKRKGALCLVAGRREEKDSRRKIPLPAPIVKVPSIAIAKS